MTGMLRAACFGRDLDAGGWPSVSVVMPLRNEAAHLERSVGSVLAQDYPLPFDVCLAIGPSGDDTVGVATRLAEREPRVRVVANPAGLTPAGLNAAIAATDGEVIVRVDGHAALSPGYIRRAVETMVRTGAVNVGGRQVPQPETAVERAVADATTSWLGTGGATYRLGGAEGPVDTVYLGVFDRAAGDAVGWFADDLVRNQDYEFNIRLRAAGGIVWFDPELWVGYRPRGTFRSLARQYHDYGFWKAEVLRRHPESLRLRQVVPGALVPALVLSAVVARPRWWPALAYALLISVPSRPWSLRFDRAAAVGTMHLAWSTGFCRGLARWTVGRSGRRPLR